MELIRRFFQEPKTSFFLFGPRGTGKSTLLKEQFGKGALYIDLLSPDYFREFIARPERLKEIISGNPDKKVVIIDEVQKAPQLLDVIHQAIEENKRLKFILTGSSARKLKRTGVDLLAGRAILRSLHPFIASELGSSFNLKKAIEYGLLPLVHGSPEPQQTLKSYVSLYLNEEIKSEGMVRNIGDFSRFLEVISFSNGSVLNASEIARECQVGRKTVEGYLSVLEDLMLSYHLPVFSKRAKRQLVAHSKFYFFDTGVYRVLRPSGPFDTPQEIGGIALETMVMQHLVAWNAYSGDENKLFYWRTKSGNEVDFIVYGKDEIFAIEVKQTGSIKSKDLKGLKSFKEDYPQAQCLLLYMGKDKLKIDNILCLPCEYFLKNLLPNKKIPT